MKFPLYLRIAGCSLPPVTVEPETSPGLIDAYQLLLAGMLKNDSERERNFEEIRTNISEIVVRFDIEKFNKLNILRGCVIQLLQAEIDLRKRFDVWVHEYIEFLKVMRDDAQRVEQAVAAKISDQILSSPGFDDDAKAHASKAEGVVQLHPEVRAAKSRTEYLNSAASALETSSLDGIQALNRDRIHELHEAISHELKAFISSEGLVPTFAWHHQFAKIDCREFLDTFDRTEMSDEDYLRAKHKHLF